MEWITPREGRGCLIGLVFMREECRVPIGLMRGVSGVTRACMMAVGLRALAKALHSSTPASLRLPR